MEYRDGIGEVPPNETHEQSLKRLRARAPTQEPGDELYFDWKKATEAKREKIAEEREDELEEIAEQVYKCRRGLKHVIPLSSAA